MIVLFFLGVNLQFIGERYLNSHNFNDVAFYKKINYIGLNNKQVFAYIYKINNILNPKAFSHAQYNEWATDRFFTVIVTTDSTKSPIMEMHNTLPPSIVNLKKAKEHYSDYNYIGYMYIIPYLQGFMFLKGKDTIFVDGYSLLKINISFDENTYHFSLIQNDPRWTSLKEKSFMTIDSNYISDVPFALWSYGCSPTASSMVLMYWDNEGYGKLVDYYFDRYDNVMHMTRTNLPNIQKELAEKMYTDSMHTGGTNVDNIAPGTDRAANNINGYNFSTGKVYGNESNSYGWETITNEIDEGRPFNFSVLNYWYGTQVINHSTTAVGYVITDNHDSLVILHNTWDSGEHLWELHNTHAYGSSINYIYPTQPGGEKTGTVNISTFSFPSYKGLKYFLKLGYSVPNSNMKIYEALSDDKSKWKLLYEGKSISEFIYTPDTAGWIRLNVELISNGLIAADGIRAASYVEKKPEIENLSLKKHIKPSLTNLDDMIIGTKTYLGGFGSLFSVEEKDDYFYKVVEIDSISASFLIKYNDLLYVFSRSGKYNVYKNNNLVFSGEIGKRIYNVFLHNNTLIMSIPGLGGRLYKFNNDKSIEPVSEISLTSARRLSIFMDTLYFSALSKGVYVVVEKNDSLICIDTLLPINLTTVFTKSAYGSFFIDAQVLFKGDYNNHTEIKTIKSPLDLYISSYYLFVLEGDCMEIFNIKDNSVQRVAYIKTGGNIKKIELTRNGIYMLDAMKGIYHLLMHGQGNISELSHDIYTYQKGLYILNIPYGSYIEIYDVSGRVIYKGKTASDQLFLKEFNSGIYFAVIKYKELKKVIKLTVY